MTAEAAARRLECEIDGLYFFRYFYKQRTGAKALVNWHHRLMADTLQRVIDGEIKRLVINIPPGYTKTELAVINFMARGLALNPRARFMHLSYSASLSIINSSQTRAIVRSEPFQEMWQRTIRDDTDRQNLWWTLEGGGVYATSIGGQVTGFRAGQMEPGFTGALIIDDPLKAADIHGIEREATNADYNGTIRSRLAHEGVPVIVIMQRLHDNDLAGFLLRGGSGERWHHLDLPVHEFGKHKLPDDYTHAIPIEYEPADSVLWRYKHDEEAIAILSSQQLTYLCQYLQRPPANGSSGQLWTAEALAKARSVRVNGQPLRRVVGVDPSTTSKDSSDECGIVVAGSVDQSSVVEAINQYEVIADYTDRMSPEAWAKMAIYAYEMHDADAIIVETNQGGDMVELTLRNCGFTGRVISVHATRGKYLRAEPVAPLYARGQVAHHPGLTKMEAEMLNFRLNMDKSPNRVDALVYALTELTNPAGQIGW